MSSVGSKDGSSRQDEVVRRNREDYQNNESEMVKKHKAELRRISEQHYQEIENLKNSHQEQMQSMQKQSHDTISKRDHKYQKSMEEIRGMHLNQLKATAEENAKREETLRRATSGDQNQQKTQSDARFEKLNEDYRNTLVKTEEAHQSSTKQGREAQAKAIAENREKLELAFQKKNDAILDERNEKVKGLQNQLGTYRENAEGRIKDQEVRHMKDRNRDSQNLMRAVGKERQGGVDNAQILREGFSDGLETQKERYEKAMNRERQALQMSSENFETKVNQRLDGQVDRLEQENQDLEEAKTRDGILLKHQTKREIANIRDSFGKNVENAMEQRNEAIRGNNSRSAKDISDVRDELGKQLTDNSRFYLRRMEEQNRIQRMAYDNLVGDFDGRIESTNMNTDQRVKTIHEKTEEEKQRLIQMQTESHSASQMQMREQVREARGLVEKEKELAVRTMQDQMRKQELQHADRMNQVVSKYEKQVQTLKDQVLRERKIGQENIKRTVDELQRAHKLSLDQLDNKNREQVRKMSTLQSEEIRSVNKRHEEKLDHVLAEVKKT
jgi:hypothetical protein